MKLQDLRSAWNQYSSTDANRHKLNETELQDMVRSRTVGLIERLDRNIRTGFIVFALLSVLFILDDFVLSPMLSEGSRIPSWIILTDGLSVFIIMGTFVYFSICYSRTKKDYSHSNDLKHVLQSLIRILDTYRKLFRWALAVLLLVSSIAFFTGLMMGVQAAAFRQQVRITDLDQTQLVWRMIQGTIILVLLVGVLFLFFQWGFRKLYGRYIDKLRQTLKELEEGQEL